MEITFTPALDFSEIVKAFRSSGIMSDNLLKFLGVETIAEIREKQTNDKVKAVSDEVLLTFVAIKILNNHYKKSKKLWTLVEKKSRKAVLKSLEVTGKELSIYLNEVEPCFKRNQLYFTSS